MAKRKACELFYIITIMVVTHLQSGDEWWSYQFYMYAG